jgi:hypothetical protein
VLRDREVTVARGEEIRQVETLLPLEYSSTDYTSRLTVIKAGIDKVHTIPGLAQGTTSYQLLSHLLNQLQEELTTLEKHINLLDDYKDQNSDKTISSKCSLTLDKLKPSILDGFSKKLSAITLKLNFNATPQDLTDTSDDYYKLSTSLSSIIDNLRDTRLIFTNRLRLLEGLSNRVVDTELLTLLQSTACIPQGSLEQVDIIDCTKIRTGLLCSLQTVALSQRTKYNLYAIVNYRGVQLYVPDKHYLVNKDNTWYSLQCKSDSNEILDSYDRCTQYVYDTDCGQILLTESIDNFLYNCQFERQHPSTYTVTTNGTLIQGDSLEIQLLESITDHRPVKVIQTTPLLIQTNKIIRLTSNNFEENIHPNNEVTEEKIITSWLTKDEIDKLHDLVLFNEILDFDYYFEISIGIVTLLLITIACTNYKSISRISRRIYNESLEKARKAKNKQNLRENVKYTTTGKRVIIQ